VEGDKDRPVPFFGGRTERPACLRPLDRVAAISAPMILKYAIALAIIALASRSRQLCRETCHM
jgi:hypothetical protein